MTRGVRVLMHLSGSHSLKPGDVGSACEKVERTLSKSPARYSVRSSVAGHELSTEGGMGGSESAHVDIEPASFDVSWKAESMFSVPAPMLAVIDRCLGITGEVRVRVNAVFTQIPIKPPVIADDAFVRRLALLVVDLDPPNSAQKAPDTGEFKFTGMAMQSDEDTGSFVVSGSSRSSASEVKLALEYILLALSAYHKVYHK